MSRAPPREAAPTNDTRLRIFRLDSSAWPTEAVAQTDQLPLKGKNPQNNSLKKTAVGGEFVFSCWFFCGRCLNPPTEAGGGTQIITGLVLIKTAKGILRNLELQ